MRHQKIPNASGQPSSLFSTHLLPVNNSHPPYHNHWQILLRLFFIKRLSPSKSRSRLNYSIVTPRLLILISHTVTSCSQISCLSPPLRFQNYSSMSNKSSQLDYIPTSLLKSCADIFSILISHLANLSFTQATFPSKFKLALISPLLKKPGLPKSELSHFRPISNLNTIGKILERLALARLFPHISISPSFCPLQSAYRKFHSTETALLKLTNDIMETIDSGKITINCSRHVCGIRYS